jgi:GxxExxY protein
MVRETAMTLMPVEARDPETYAVIGAAMEVHRELGFGLLECPYKDALELELKARGVPFCREVEVPVFYKGQRLRSYYVADFVCFERLIVEAKAIKTLTDVDRAQTINYLKATGYERAVLLNFGAPSLQYERIVNRFGRPGRATASPTP